MTPAPETRTGTKANAARKAAGTRAWNDVDPRRYVMRLEILARPGCPVGFRVGDLTAAAAARLAVVAYDRASRKGTA